MSATGRGTKRKEYDFYSTPKHCIEAIAREIAWGENPWVLEPAAGNFAIVNVIRPYSGVVQTCEIQEPWCQDFLTQTFDRRFDFCITNPPFSLAQEFIEKSLQVANCTVMLLRLNFLASKSRKEFWQRNTPTAIHVLTKRPSFTGKGTDATDYAWFVWDSTGRQKKGWYWL